MKKKNKKLFILLAASFLISILTTIAFLSLYYFLKPKQSQQHFTENQIVEYFFNKYNWNFTIKGNNMTTIIKANKSKIEQDFKFCENLTSRKDKALCKAYLKLQELKLSQFKNYLPLALAEHNEINVSCLIKKGFDKTKLAEFLGNPALCGNDSNCSNKVESFINYYSHLDIIKENVKVAYDLYKKGLIQCDKYKECLLNH